MEFFEWLGPDNFSKVTMGFLGVVGAAVAVIRMMVGPGKPEAETKSPARMEIAGALIDGKDARALKDALDRNSLAMEQTATRWDRNSEAAVDVRDEVRELRSAMSGMSSAMQSLMTQIAISNSHHRD